MKRTLLFTLLVSCGDDQAVADLAGVDLAVAELAVSDLTPAGDLAGAYDLADARDLAFGDAGDGGFHCVAQLGPTHLYEDACPSGGGAACFIDHTPTDFF
jgi:hypothetical protein